MVFFFNGRKSFSNIINNQNTYRELWDEWKTLEYDDDCCEFMLGLYSDQMDVLFEFF